MTRRSAPSTEQSSTRATKVPGGDRASTRDPEGPSEKAAPLPEIFQSSNQLFCPLRSDRKGRLPRRRGLTEYQLAMAPSQRLQRMAGCKKLLDARDV